jgi:hypothetical protein
MKTLTYLTTLLALTIQVMLNGQTPGNQVRKIRVDIMGAKTPVTMKYTNSNITLTMEEYKQLLEQANQLKVGAQKLKEEALLAEQNYFTKQLEASQLLAQISLQKFQENKKTILVFYTQIPKTNKVYNQVTLVDHESERLMKLAKEIREEAAAQLSLQAMVGSMSNAEEKETLALNKQAEALGMIEKYLSDTKEGVVEECLAEQTEIKTIIQSDLTIETSALLMELLFEALTQADNMRTTSQSLREKALMVPTNEKNILINEAVTLEKEYIAKRVEISNLKSALIYDKFNQNRLMISELISKVKENTDIVNYAYQLSQEAERLMKMGKEMREEANAQFSYSAKYGSISNAEEAELFAIGKQVESIQFIEKNNSSIVIASR